MIYARSPCHVLEPHLWVGIPPLEGICIDCHCCVICTQAYSALDLLSARRCPARGHPSLLHRCPLVSVVVSIFTPALPSSMATIFKRARATSYSRNDAIFVLGELLLIDANGGRTSITPGRGSMLVESWIPVFSVADPMPTTAPPPPSSSAGTTPSTLISAPVDPTTSVLQEPPPSSTPASEEADPSLVLGAHSGRG